MERGAMQVPSVVKRVFHPPRGEAGWEPFDDAQGKSLLAGLDFCFLSAYAVGMFFTGTPGSPQSQTLLVMKGGKRAVESGADAWCRCSGDGGGSGLVPGENLSEQVLLSIFSPFTPLGLSNLVSILTNPNACAGHIADSMDLRVYLTLGSAASGALACVYGALYFLNVHTVPVYYALMLAMGLAQSTGCVS
jgi:hypothetical protein